LVAKPTLSVEWNYLLAGDKAASKAALKSQSGGYRGRPRWIDTLVVVTEPSPLVLDERAWQDDVAVLIAKPRAAWNSDRPLARKIAGHLLRDQSEVTQSLRDHVIAQALANADAADTSPDSEARALRENVRGIFWLPSSIDDYNGSAKPPSMEDLHAVTQNGIWNAHRVEQRRRSGMLRYWRAKGERDKHTSPADALNSGNGMKSAIIERLIEDLEVFFNDEDALEDFAPMIERQRIHERFLRTRRASSSLQRRLRQVAASLNRLSPIYPEHLDVSDLAANRSVARVHKNDETAGADTALDTTSAVAKSVGTPALRTIVELRRVVVLGDSGSGKSTLARALVINVVEAEPGGVAVYVAAAPLARALAESSEPWLVTLSRMALSLRLDRPREEDVRELERLLATEFEALVVLDGIDEVFDPKERTLLSEVTDALDGLRCRVLITSRLTGYRHRRRWSEYKPLPLDAYGFEQLLVRWYGESHDEVNRRLRRVLGAREFTEMVGHPVLAGIVARLAGQPGSDVTTSRPALYRQAVAHLCQRLWKTPEHDERDAHEVIALLKAYQQAAWDMAGVTTVTSLGALDESGIDSALVRSGELLQPVGLDDSAEIDRPWNWLHSSFSDYFVGAHLHRLVKNTPTEASRALERAIQYPEGWLEALRFLVDGATATERSWIAQQWVTLAREGDPGRIIANTAREVFRDYPAERARFAGTEAVLRALVLEAEREELAVRIDASPADSALESLKRMTSGDHTEAFLRRPILRGDVVKDSVVVDEYWRAFLGRPYPLNLPFALAMGGAFFTRQVAAASDDYRLAAWIAATQLHRPHLERAASYVPSSQLRSEVIAGRFGEWGALCGVLQSPNEAQPIDASSFVRVAQLIRAESLERPGEFEASSAATLVTFDIADTLDVSRSVLLLETVLQVTNDDPDDTIDALVLLSDRLGGMMPWRRYARAAVNSDDLSRLVRGRISRHLESLDTSVLVRSAYRLHAAGNAIAPSAVPREINDYDARNRRDWPPFLDFFDWYADVDPGRLDDWRGWLRDPADDQFPRRVAERIGSRVRPNSHMHSALAYTLSASGALPEWRSVLLGPRSSDTPSLPEDERESSA
jgi:energy-coupling factor transporter ATP-binding protein EcfA2